MAEVNPYPEENELEDTVVDELLALLALAFVQAPKIDNFTLQSFSTIQDRFRTQVSEALPMLYGVSQDAIKVGLDRAMSDLSLSNLSFDFTDPRLQAFVNRVYQDNIDLILDTNEQMFAKLQQIAQDKGWTEAELHNALKRYYGLTPTHLQTIVNLEDSLRAEGFNTAQIIRKVQKRIDRLVEWRIRLFSNLVATDVVEGSKDISWSAITDRGDLDRMDYQKQWVSVVDGGTTEFCLSSNGTRAEIGGYFPNGRPHPPGFPPIHPCRSAMIIVRRRGT